MNRMKLALRSIFTRILCIFLFALLPLYGVGMEIYNWGIEAVRADLLDNRISQMKFQVSTLEKELTNVMQLQSDCLNSDKVNWFSNAYPFISDYQRGQNMLELGRQLAAIQNSCLYIQDVTLYFPRLNKKISTDGSADSLSPEDWTLLRSKTTMGTELLFKEGHLSTHSSVIIKDNVFYALVVQFSSSRLESSLSHFENNESSHTYLMNTADATPIYSTAPTGWEKALWQELLTGLQPKKAVGSSTVQTAFPESKIIPFKGEEWMLLQAGSQSLPLSICSIVPLQVVFSPIKQYEKWLWIFGVLTTIIIALFSLSIHRLIHRPLKKLVNAFEQVDGGDLTVTMKEKGNDEFGYLYRRFNEMLKSLRNLIAQSYQQRIMLQQAELKQLQAQINPHFLYNSYFFLHRIIKQQDFDKATAISKNMGTYFQYITRNVQERVPLKREVEHAQIYCSIQTMRFEERIVVEFGTLPQAYESLEVPRLILQPLIENCFGHGLQDKEKEGILRVSILVEEEKRELSIWVEDNGETTTDLELEQMRERLEDTDCETTAVINIHRRLQMTFEGKGGLQILRSSLGGVKIILTLPL